jgi:predicted signal transduction protein with EAL and GGDEF domain
MQADFLRDHGCEELQGYYFGRPLPAAQPPPEFLPVGAVAGAGGPGTGDGTGFAKHPGRSVSRL